MKNDNIRMRADSGTVTSDDKLVIFIYLLLRDGLNFGAVERLVDASTHEKTAVFTNGWAATHAMDIASRLRKPNEV